MRRVGHVGGCRWLQRQDPKPLGDVDASESPIKPTPAPLHRHPHGLIGGGVDRNEAHGTQGEHLAHGNLGDRATFTLGSSSRTTFIPDSSSRTTFTPDSSSRTTFIPGSIGGTGTADGEDLLIEQRRRQALRPGLLLGHSPRARLQITEHRGGHRIDDGPPSVHRHTARPRRIGGRTALQRHRHGGVDLRHRPGITRDGGHRISPNDDIIATIAPRANGHRAARHRPKGGRRPHPRNAGRPRRRDQVIRRPRGKRTNPDQRLSIQCHRLTGENAEVGQRRDIMDDEGLPSRRRSTRRRPETAPGTVVTHRRHWLRYSPLPRRSARARRNAPTPCAPSASTRWRATPPGRTAPSRWSARPRCGHARP